MLTTDVTLSSMQLTGAILENVRRAFLVDGTCVEIHELRSPVGLDFILEARGRRWHVVGVVPAHAETRALCVPHRF
ncbi:MAG: hypothetical protein ACXVRK_00560 [Gaiellaceae bacterium]